MINPLSGIRYIHYLYILLVTAFILVSCRPQKTPSPLGDVMSDSARALADYDLPDIEVAGELIAVTISGPDTYYELRGRALGLQYLLAERFANSLGLRLRMEVARDTLELLAQLREARADLIAYPLSRSLLEREGLIAGGFTQSDSLSWSVRSASPLLADALKDWYRPQLLAETREDLTRMLQTPHVRRTVHAVYLNRSKGIISAYDHLLLAASRSIGWDWRLLAALCYQESAFDPKAESWAGARGLMQIMPRTALELGVEPSQLYQPELNIRTSAKYLGRLQQNFSDITNPDERKKFVLAAYNGGYLHIRDAQNLARKYGRNPQLWDEVSPFVLRLSQARYYRDPVVRYGYMIGSETYHYVYHILDRWADYRGVARTPHTVPPMASDVVPSSEVASERVHKPNRFTRSNSGVIGRDDSIFQVPSH